MEKLTQTAVNLMTLDLKASHEAYLNEMVPVNSIEYIPLETTDQGKNLNRQKNTAKKAGLMARLPSPLRQCS